MRTYGWAVAALALVAVAGAAIQDATAVRLRMNTGEVYKFKSETKSSMSISGALEMSSDSTQSMVRTFKISDAKEGWTPFTISNSEVEIKSDGETPMGGPSTDDLKKLTEQIQMTGEFNEFGQVRGFTLKGADQTDPMVAMALGGAGQAMNDLGIMGLKFPSDGIKAGTTWTQKFYMGRMLEDVSGGMVSSSDAVDVVYKVISVEDYKGKPHAVITALTAGTLKVSSPQAGDGTMEANGTTKMWVDMQTGVTTKFESDMSQVIDMSVVIVSNTMNTKEERIQD